MSTKSLNRFFAFLLFGPICLLLSFNLFFAEKNSIVLKNINGSLERVVTNKKKDMYIYVFHYSCHSCLNFLDSQNAGNSRSKYYVNITDIPEEMIKILQNKNQNLYADYNGSLISFLAHRGVKVTTVPLYVKCRGKTCSEINQEAFINAT